MKKKIERQLVKIFNLKTLNFLGFLYGELKRRFCRSLEVDVSDTTELMHALDGNFPGFIQYIIKSHVEGVDYSLTKNQKKTFNLLLEQKGMIF